MNVMTEISFLETDVMLSVDGKRRIFLLAQLLLLNLKLAQKSVEMA